MEFLKNVFRYHKSKILLFFGMIVAFAIVFFPYDDLSDLISSQVAEATGNTVYIQFEDLSLGFLPQPGVKMSNVVIEHPMISGELRADTLKAAPSILAAIKQLPLLRLKMENLFKGDLDLTTAPASKMNAPMAINADVEYTNFDLNALVKTLVPIPMKANGTMNLSAAVDWDLEMKSQPDGVVALNSQKVDIPAFNLEISTPSANGMPIKQSIAIPSLNLGRVQIKGKLKDGKLIFENTVIGSDKSDIFAKVGGDMDIKVLPGTVQPTYYNIQLDLTLKNSFLAALGSYATMVDLMIGKYAQKTADGKRYLFRLQMNPMVDAAPIFAPF